MLVSLFIFSVVSINYVIELLNYKNCNILCLHEIINKLKTYFNNRCMILWSVSRLYKLQILVKK